MEAVTASSVGRLDFAGSAERSPLRGKAARFCLYGALTLLPVRVCSTVLLTARAFAPGLPSLGDAILGDGLLAVLPTDLVPRMVLRLGLSRP